MYIEVLILGAAVVAGAVILSRGLHRIADALYSVLHLERDRFRREVQREDEAR